MSCVLRYRKFILCFVLFIVLYTSTLAGGIRQNLSKSRKYFDKALLSYRSSQYENAETFLLRSIQLDTTNVRSFLLLSDLSVELKKKEQQITSLEKVIEIAPSAYPLAHKLLAECYSDIGRFDDALRQWRVYQSFGVKKDSLKLEKSIVVCQNAIQLLAAKRDVKIVHFDSLVNTGLNEYWPVVAADDSMLYFTRLITNEKQFAFERLFFSERQGDEWMPAMKLTLSENEDINEGTMSMTADGRLLFITICGGPYGKGSCDIYYIENEKGHWSSPINAGSKVNSERWEAQPSVSACGDFLYWASNRRGGFGAKDIWMAPILNNDQGNITFGDPVNLGDGVNSSEDDFSPFIHADDQTLYFASKGKLGLGKSDLFISRNRSGRWSDAVNLGYPINSIDEDDGLVVSPTAQVAVFSSDRKGAFDRSKDLYQLNLPIDFLPGKVGYVKGSVYDAKTKNPIEAEIRLANLETKVSRLIDVDANTGFLTVLKANQMYAFQVSKPGYLFYSKHFDLKKGHDKAEALVVNIFLEPIEKGATVVLNNVFFDFDSYHLKKESMVEMQSVVEFLQLNPSVKVEISGHTDSQGEVSYNQKLSENRAKVIGDTLKKYIDDQRIEFKGYGSTRPIADNDTEMGRQKNRRSELRIIGL